MFAKKSSHDADGSNFVIRSTIHELLMNPINLSFLGTVRLGFWKLKKNGEAEDVQKPASMHWPTNWPLWESLPLFIQRTSTKLPLICLKNLDLWNFNAFRKNGKNHRCQSKYYKYILCHKQILEALDCLVFLFLLKWEEQILRGSYINYVFNRQEKKWVKAVKRKQRDLFLIVF